MAHEAGQAERRQRGLGPAGDHDVGVAPGDDPERVADGVRAGGAGRGRWREFGPLAPKRMEIWPEASLMIVWMRKNGETRSGPFSSRTLCHLLDRAEAADAGPDVDAGPVALEVAGRRSRNRDGQLRPRPRRTG